MECWKDGMLESANNTSTLENAALDRFSRIFKCFCGFYFRSIALYQLLDNVDGGVVNGNGGIASTDDQTDKADDDMVNVDGGIVSTDEYTDKAEGGVVNVDGGVVNTDHRTVNTDELEGNLNGNFHP